MTCSGILTGDCKDICMKVVLFHVRDVHKQMVRMLGLTIAIIVVAYLLSAVAMFDFFAPAEVEWEQINADGCMVAIGPRPRYWITQPAQAYGHYVYYEPSQRVFRVYAPVCKLWRVLCGYKYPTPSWRDYVSTRRCRASYTKTSSALLPTV